LPSYPIDDAEWHSERRKLQNRFCKQRWSASKLCPDCTDSRAEPTVKEVQRVEYARVNEPVG